MKEWLITLLVAAAIVSVVVFLERIVLPNMNVEGFQIPLSKERRPTCSEANDALITVMSYITKEFNDDGPRILTNIRDTFFEIDQKCLNAGGKNCNIISFKRSLQPETMLDTWSSPLTCARV